MTGDWSFAYDDAKLGLTEKWWNRTCDFENTIHVPYPPESSASGIGDTSPHPVVWYRRTFKVPDGHDKSCWILHFGAVDYRAHVYVNGQLVATHVNGMTPFQADVTAVLSPDLIEQVLVVRAEDEPRDLAQPRGKQDWRDQAHIIWYDRTTGIWQPVWLEPTGRTHIDEIRWTPDADIGLLSLETKLNHRPAHPLHLRLRLWLRDRLLCDDVYTISEQMDRRDVFIHS